MNAKAAQSIPIPLLVAAAMVGCGGGADEPSGSSYKPDEPALEQFATATPQPRVAPLSHSASASRMLDDSAITMKIKQALLADAEVKRTDLSVDTRKGVVTLRGTVGSQEYIDKAVTIARGADGVVEVRSLIAVALYVPVRAR